MPISQHRDPKSNTYEKRVPLRPALLDEAPGAGSGFEGFDRDL